MEILFTLTFAYLITAVQGYPDYVPELACGDFFPSAHGVNAMNNQSSTSTPPYIITVNATTYQPGDVIEIFLNSTKSGDDEFAFYEGVFIQARRADCSSSLYTKPVGTFFLETNETFLTTMTCNGIENSAVRHNKHEHVYSSTFYWRAPENSTGHIYFRGTIARRKTTFWTNVYSEYIKEYNSSVALPSTYCSPRTDYRGCPSVYIPPAAAANLLPGNFLILLSFFMFLHGISE